jgi:hypothetical protein
LAEWTRRYLLGHGPATPADFAAWTKLPLGTARRGFAAVRQDFEVVVVDDVEHLVDPEVADLLPAHRKAARGLHLLPGFDEFILGYADRSHVLAPEHVDKVAPGGNGIFRGTVVAAGNVVGTFTRAGSELDVEPFSALSASQTAALARRTPGYPSGWLDAVAP